MFTYRWANYKQCGGEGGGGGVLEQQVLSVKFQFIHTYSSMILIYKNREEKVKKKQSKTSLHAHWALS